MVVQVLRIMHMCVQYEMSYKEDVMVSRDASLPHHAMISLATPKHLPHVFTDDNSERLAQCNLRRWPIKVRLTLHQQKEKEVEERS